MTPSTAVRRGEPSEGRTRPRRQVIVYVDGFALYKGLLQRKHQQFKWLDLVALAERLFPRYEVVQVRYFTALLKPLPGDPQVPQRQQTYLRALGTLERLSIHYGTFIFTKQWLPPHPQELDEAGQVRTIQVKRPEEKGSDVALASHLMLDALRDRADLYAVVTNDSDLVEPLRLLATEGRRDVGLVSVAGRDFNRAFTKVPGLTIREIRKGTLAASQLPLRLQDAQGRWIRKPGSWP